MIFFSANHGCEQQRHKAMFLTPGGRKGAGPSYASSLSSITKSIKSNQRHLDGRVGP